MRRELKTETFKQSETKGFHKIGKFFEETIGFDNKCPKCKNNEKYQIFFNSELMSINTLVDRRTETWRIEAPLLGPITIKEIRCLKCGYKGKLKEFKEISNGQ